MQTRCLRLFQEQEELEKSLLLYFNDSEVVKVSLVFFVLEPIAIDR